ncbi:MAG: hypothetical protein IH630_02630 [Thermoplasmata archaeon]|nr:hypothetical protein [Thermoplasmata archaeon]MCJ7562458.1 hypothetical protein [Thermoplasmata archaeon]
MARCSRCGKEIGSVAQCPSCGYPPSQSVVGKGINKAAGVTGEVIEKSVDVAEKVVKETRPVFKRVIDIGKKGVSKAKSKTLEVAKDLKEKDQ